MSSSCQSTSELSIRIYHEKQRHQLCLLHALNNLLQRQEFKQSDLDVICENLDERRWLNPHRSWIGLGNYDANVLISALELKDLSVVWFDNRLSATQINQDLVLAYIFNIPSTGYVPIPFFPKGRHWFTVLRFNSIYYNLDSKLQEPTIIDDFILFTNKLLSEGNQLLLVTRPENAELCVNK